MDQIKQFKDFGIKPVSKGFEGDKIKIGRIINREIVVVGYKIEDSKFEGKGKCLYVQIEIDGDRRVFFTGSNTLMELIQQVPKANFPFKTTIIKENERFEFS